MRRREFITLVGGVAAWPVTARAQTQAHAPVIGFLAANQYVQLLRSFQRSLNDAGFVEGRNVAIEYRFAEGRYDRLPALAADLVQREVAVIAAVSTPCALAARGATRAIPIVFAAGVDPVAVGLVASLARPGGNVTGVSELINEVVAKRLELLRKMAPEAASIAMITNPANPVPSASEREEARNAARVLGVRLLLFDAGTPDEIEKAFASAARQQAGALLVGVDALYITQRDQVVGLAERYAIPAMFPESDAVRVGGLVSYGSSRADAYRQLGAYASRILKGERPADLPVQQAVKIELAINLTTAKVLGLTIPETLLATADEVIQ
jgi:putative tryptophan/tyrosine transport system substrate-binding protein